MFAHHEMTHPTIDKLIPKEIQNSRFIRNKITWTCFYKFQYIRNKSSITYKSYYMTEWAGIAGIDGKIKDNAQSGKYINT